MRLFSALFLLMMFYSSAFADGLSTLSFDGGKISAQTLWLQGPRTKIESTMKIQWIKTEDNSATAPPGQFTVSLFMPSMGHGSSPTQIQQYPELGAYLVKSMYFIMDGDWEVQVTVQYPDGKSETQKLQVPNVP